MKPIKKTKIVTTEVEYWTCSNKDHSHRTERVAQMCADRQELSESRVVIDYKARDLELIKLVLGGNTYSEAAKDFGISPTGVSTIMRMFVRRLTIKSRKAGLEKGAELYGLYTATEIYPKRAELLDAWSDYNGQKCLRT